MTDEQFKKLLDVQIGIKATLETMGTFIYAMYTMEYDKAPSGKGQEREWDRVYNTELKKAREEFGIKHKGGPGMVV